MVLTPDANQMVSALATLSMFRAMIKQGNGRIVMSACFLEDAERMILWGPTQQHTASVNVLQCIPHNLASFVLLSRNGKAGVIKVESGKDHSSPNGF